MIRFHEVDLTNIIYYKKANLKFEQGLTVIGGHNKNSGSQDARRNGAGKSLLLTALPHLAFGDPMGKKVNKHSLFSDKDAKINWDLSVGDNHWNITKHKTGSGTPKWTLIKNGEDLEPRTSVIAEQLVKELLPLNEEEFFSTVYVDSRRPNVMQTGTSANRINYFTDLFRLYDFDKVKRYFGSELKELTKKKAQVEVLQTTLEPLEWSLTLNGEELATAVKEAKKRLRKVSRELRKVEHDIGEQKAYDKTSDLREAATCFNKNKYVRLAAKRERLMIYAQDLTVYEGYLGKKAAYLTRVKASGLSGKNLIKAQAKEVSRWEQDLEDYGQLNGDYIRNNKEWELHLNQPTLNRVKKPKEAKPTEALYTLRSKIGALVLDTDKCTECGQKIDAVQNQEKHTKYLKKLKVLAKVNTEWLLYEEYLDLKKDKVRKPEDKLKPVEKPLKPRCYGLDLRTPEPVVKPDAVVFTKQNEKEYAAQKGYAQACATLATLDLEGTGSSTEALTKIKVALEEQQVAAQNKLDAVTSQLIQYEQVAPLAQKTEATLQDLTKDLENLDLFSVVESAYGSKGLKLMVMQSLSNKIVETMNLHAHRLSSEKLTFSINVGINNFEILVKRADGRESDVRFLSGAESRIFTLLWLIAILPLIPSECRSDLIVLDEFEAGLDQVTRDLLLTEFLPSLLTIVPKIVFITPNEVDFGDHRYMAVKQGKETTLVAV